MVVSRSTVGRWVAVAAIFAGGSASARAGFTITDLGVIAPSGTSAATAINGNGVAAGVVTSGSGGMEAANSSSGTLQPVSVPQGATSSMATSINGAGVVAGSFSGPGISQEAFFSGSGGATALGFISANGGNGTTSQANGINGSGQVVGTGNVYEGANNRAFIYQGGVLTMIAPLGATNPATSPLANWANGINNSGTVVGTSEVVAGGLQQAFYTGANGTPINLTTRNSAGSFQGNMAGTAIANDGDIVGYGVVGTNNQAFYASASGGSLVDLGTLGSSLTSMALGVNDNALVVGTSGGQAFLWGQSEGMYSLSSLVDPAELSGWVLTEATGINDNDQISGEGYLDGVLHGFILTPIPGESPFTLPGTVPEPPALVLATVGLAIAWGWSRRRIRTGRTGAQAGA